MLLHLQEYTHDKYCIVQTKTSRSSADTTSVEDLLSEFTEITILATGDHYNIHDPSWQESPLHLAALLVQEDFVLLAPSDPVEYTSNNNKEKDENSAQHQEPPLQQHIFVAGACCFSFTETGLQGGENLSMGGSEKIIDVF